MLIFSSDYMMSENEIMSLHGMGMEIEVHTVNHPILLNEPFECITKELLDSKVYLEELLEHRVTSFAYPNGHFGTDYDETVSALVKETGFMCAVHSTDAGVNARTDNMYQLKRFTPWNKGVLKYGVGLLQNTYGNSLLLLSRLVRFSFMTKLLYLTSSSYSGSTLFTFLVNQHPDIFTIGELEGWDYNGEEYKCSCGELIELCPFFTAMGETFRQHDLVFSTKNFGTKLKLSNNEAINRYLTSSMPYLGFSLLERTRDLIVRNMPGFSKIINNAMKSNKLFIESSLDYSGAKVFVDATKNPYRLRMLRDIDGIDVQVLYMVRDVRGVVASNVRKKGISIKVATLKWLREQENILRVINEFPRVIRLNYEDLCMDPVATLSHIYADMGLVNYTFGGDVRSGDHHILGNAMRVTDVNEIRLDERWRDELDVASVDEIERISREYVAGRNNGRLKDVVFHYIGEYYGKAA